MDVTTINITTVGLSNTESEVNYESDLFANRASSPCMQWCGGEPLILIQCSPNRAGRFPITRLTNLIFRREPYVQTGLEKQVRLPLKCTKKSVLRPLLPFQESTTALVVSQIGRAGLPIFWVGNSLPKREERLDQEKGVLRALCPTHLTSSRGSPVPPTRPKELFSRYRGALEAGGVLSLLGWALPHKAPPSGHKRPLATHMRGAVLAFPDQDRSHTCSVRDRPTQLCIDWKAGISHNQRSGYVQYVPPSSRHAMVPRGG